MAKGSQTIEDGTSTEALANEFRLYPNPEKPGYIAELTNGRLIRISTRLGEYLRGKGEATDKVVAIAEKFNLHPDNLREEIELDARGRWTVQSLLKVQFELVSPNGTWGVFEKIAKLLNPVFFLVSVVLVFIVGVVTLFLRSEPSYHSFVTPLNLLAFLGVLPAIFITTVVHEAAHALMLLRYGHGMRRAGLMLFFFMPSAFCDVTPAWLLSRGQRVVVCLAGAFTQLGLAGIALIIASVLEGDWRQIMDLYAFAIAFTAFINLIPFVKFDGYLALISWLDEPSLIERSRKYVGDYTAQLVVTGEARDDFKLGLYTFGIMCYLTPALLVVGALSALMGTLVALGIVGKLLIFLALLVIIGSISLAVQGLVARMRQIGASVAQIAVTISLVVGLIAVALLIPVEQKGTAAYKIDADKPDKAVLAVAPGVVNEGDVPEEVLLENRGMVRVPQLMVSLPGNSESCTADQLAQTPFYLSGVEAPGEFDCYEIDVSANPDLPHEGLASFQQPTVSLAKYLYDRAIGINLW